MIDNSQIIAEFCPKIADGDTFIYTELLDRAKRKGNNGQRIVRTYYHRSVEEFWTQWPLIKALCDATLTRACTRLAPRSFAKVGREFARLVVDAALSDNWAGMKTLYARACGIVSPNTKLWLFDVDEICDHSEALKEQLRVDGYLVAVIPSKKGEHLITNPHHAYEQTIAIHKDNPTNLYIPAGAA